MTQDEIIAMAEEAGMEEAVDGLFYATSDSLQRFAALVEAKAAANERDACAQVAAQTVCDTHIPTGINIYGTRAAKAIRARSTT